MAPRLWCAGFIANRSELQALCGLPASAADGEILCGLFRRYGVQAARRITGSLAWVLLDPVRGELFAARDRAGVHGIYYAEVNGRVLVGDRIRQIRAGLPDASLNRRSLVAQIHGCAPLPGETPWAEVRALEPGSMLVGSADGLRVEHYWRLEPRRTLRLASDAAYAEALRDLLFTVVDQHRPPEASAVALSSGLDSTSIAAALRATDPEASYDLYTIGTPELPTADETAGATAVADHLGSRLEVIRGDELWPLSGAEGIHTIEEGPTIVYQETWEELFARLQRRGTRVAFTGASGDHLFGGTGVLVYPDLMLTGRWVRLARLLGAHRDRSRERLLRILHRDLLRPLVSAYLPQRWAAARRRVSWLDRACHPLLAEVLPGKGDRWRHLPGRRLRLQALRDPKLPHSLSLLTALAGRYGVELRHPLTDHRLLEFAASLPLEQCLRAGVAKFILRRAMRDHLPACILDNPDRTYPLALFERGLRHRERAKVRRLITGMRAAEIGLVDETQLQLAYERYLEGSGGTLFWHTLTLEDWLRRYA